MPTRTSLAGQSINNVIWIANTNAQTIDVRDVETGAILNTYTPPFFPRNISIMESGEVFTSAGDPDGTEGTISAVVLDPRGNVLREYDLNRLGWLKSGCPVRGSDQHVIACSQDNRTICRIDVGSYPERVLWTAQTGQTPRGVVMDRDGDIWVCCKVGNTGVAEGRFAQLYCHDGDTGKIKFGVPVPFGARGVTVDMEGDAWGCCLGDQPAGNGNSVFQVSKTTRTVRNVVRVGDGPFAIVVNSKNEKFAACTLSNEVWKIDADGVPVETGGWPFDGTDVDPSADGAATIALDGLERVWVGFKVTPYIARLSGVDATIQLNLTTEDGRPETLGDHTGHYRALALSPNVDSDGDGVSNLDELLAGSNPFDRFSS